MHQQAARREPVAQPAQQPVGKGPFGRARGVGVPFGRVPVGCSDEGRLAADGQTHVGIGQLPVDRPPDGIDRVPLVFGVGLGHPGRLQHPGDRHGVVEADIGRLVAAGDRCSALRRRRCRQGQVPFAREQAGCGVEADPAGARGVGFGPGVEVGEVRRRPRRPIDRLLIGSELDQVARDEPRGDAQMAQHMDQQPAAVAARAAAERQRLLRRLDARFHADDVLDRLLDALVGLDQEVDRVDIPLPDGIDQAGQARGRGRHLQIGLQVLAQLGRIGEGDGLGTVLDEEVERVDHRHLGDQVHGDLEMIGGLVKDQTGQVVAERVLLPVDEVIARPDRLAIVQYWGARVRGRTQADDLGAEPDRPIVAIGRAVGQRGMDAHRGKPSAGRRLWRARDIIAGG